MRVTWFSTIALALCSSTFASAKPISRGQCALTPEKLVAIAPKSTTCDGAPAVGECRTASQATPFIRKSFQTYNVTSPAEQAALISLMAFETDDFKYNKNHFPGVPGQGTRNMQSPDFNALYAKSIPALRPELGPVSGQPEAVLDLLLTEDAYDFGSAAWFLTTQCPSKVRTSLKTGSEEGWKTYLTSCIGTTVTEDRKVVWERAVKVLRV